MFGAGKGSPGIRRQIGSLLLSVTFLSVTFIVFGGGGRGAPSLTHTLCGPFVDLKESPPMLIHFVDQLWAPKRYAGVL